MFKDEKDGKSYRGKILGLSLNELIGKNDDLDNNECCKRVSYIKNTVVEIQKDEDLLKTRCFSLQGFDEIWTFCNSDVPTLE
jgi:hypothetical protein